MIKMNKYMNIFLKEHLVESNLVIVNFDSYTSVPISRQVKNKTVQTLK